MSRKPRRTARAGFVWTSGESTLSPEKTRIRYPGSTTRQIRSAVQNGSVHLIWQAAIGKKMDQAYKHMTAFATHLGLFEFNVMPFGPANAAATFERLMETVLKDLSWKKCLCYLDDVIVFGKDFQSTLANLEQIFLRFRQANLKLKPKRCALFQREIMNLGHLVTGEGIKCDLAKTEVVEKWAAPRNSADVRSFLGLVGYYRKFIEDFSKTAYTLVKFLKKNTKFCWNTACEDAFRELKTRLVSAPILSFPTRNDRFVLDCDASANEIGAVLSQRQSGEESVISYATKTLNDSQRN